MGAIDRSTLLMQRLWPIRYEGRRVALILALTLASVLALPAAVSFAHGAVMMCSSATALHALRKARLAPGETVAVFGLGGLGASAIQLARALGADPLKLMAAFLAGDGSKSAIARKPVVKRRA